MRKIASIILIITFICQESGYGAQGILRPPLVFCNKLSQETASLRNIQILIDKYATGKATPITNKSEVTVIPNTLTIHIQYLFEQYGNTDPFKTNLFYKITKEEEDIIAAIFHKDPKRGEVIDRTYKFISEEMVKDGTNLIGRWKLIKQKDVSKDKTAVLKSPSAAKEIQKAPLEDALTRDRPESLLSKFKHPEILERINSYKDKFKALPDGELLAKTKEFKDRLAKGESLDSLLGEAFAVVREAALRNEYVHEWAYVEQLEGAIDLHQGKAIEMKNGEGKSLAGIFAIYLNALTGKGVHVNTFTDSLARQYVQRYGHILHMLGLSVSVVEEDEVLFFNPRFNIRGTKYRFFTKGPSKKRAKKLLRKRAYLQDVTFGATEVFMRDELLDGRVTKLKDKVQRGYEPELTLVDDGVGRLVEEVSFFKLSLPAKANYAKDNINYQRIYDLFAEPLEKDTHYSVDEINKEIKLNSEGESEIEKIKEDHAIFRNIPNLDILIECALFAKEILHKDIDYIVENGKLIIIDENNGRRKIGYEYDWPIQQFVQAKEGIEITKPSIILTETTHRSHFRKKKKLAIMDGDISEEAEDILKADYKLITDRISERVESKRKNETVFYKTYAEMAEAISRGIADYIEEVGGPILVCARSSFEIGKDDPGGLYAQTCNRMNEKGLDPKKIKILVLDPKYHEGEETKTIRAGEDGIALLSTMLKIGTDIKLIGKQAKKAGLLVIIIGTPDTRRKLTQAQGRAARHGDPGSTRWYISLDDRLIRLYATEEEKKYIQTVIRRTNDNQAIKDSEIEAIVYRVQKRSEKQISLNRKNILKYDNLLSPLQDSYYGLREFILRNIDNVRAKRSFLNSLERGWRSFLTQREQLKLTARDIEDFKEKSDELFERVFRGVLKYEDELIIDKIREELLKIPLGNIIKSIIRNNFDREYAQKMLIGLAEQEIKQILGIADMGILNVKDSEKRQIIISMFLNGFNRPETSEALGISVKALRYKLRQITDLSESKLTELLGRLGLNKDPKLAPVIKDIIRNNFDREYAQKMLTGLAEQEIKQILGITDIDTLDIVDSEKRQIIISMFLNGCNRKETSEALGMPVRTLRYKLRQITDLSESKLTELLGRLGLNKDPKLAPVIKDIIRNNFDREYAQKMLTGLAEQEIKQILGIADMGILNVIDSEKRQIIISMLLKGCNRKEASEALGIETRILRNKLRQITELSDPKLTEILKQIGLNFIDSPIWDRQKEKIEVIMKMNGIDFLIEYLKLQSQMPSHHLLNGFNSHEAYESSL